MNIEQVSQAAMEFGNEAGERLQSLLGRVPDPQEFMTFYAMACATICGNALSEIVTAAGKETGAQWLSEVLGMVQLTARRNARPVAFEDLGDQGDRLVPELERLLDNGPDDRT